MINDSGIDLSIGQALLTQALQRLNFEGKPKDVKVEAVVPLERSESSVNMAIKVL